MQSTRRRSSEIEGNAERGSFADNSPRTREDDIAQRAYERYEARGREHGHALDDWLDAERELNAARYQQ
jgi:hypothetical protein